jgi:hypothetical protein
MAKTIHHQHQDADEHAERPLLVTREAVMVAMSIITTARARTAGPIGDGAIKYPTSTSTAATNEQRNLRRARVLAGSVIPAVVPPINTVFDAGLVAVSWSDASGEKRASRSGCEHEHERSCDPLSGDRGE